jgi:2-oxoglutarate/2-oxoacid ferredoxin oxidoreductase subunit alpha
MAGTDLPTAPEAESGRREVESVVVRFAGDSGDGIQLTGSQFTLSTALIGNDLATFPDFPAEIRAPVGTTYGVSAFQINFGASRVMTAGDEPDLLVALNPAALKVNIDSVRPGGMVVIDTGTCNARNLRKAGYEGNPLEDGTLAQFKTLPIDISQHTEEALRDFGLSQKEMLRSKNMWALGLVYWMYGRERQPSIDWLKQKFAKRPEIAEANIAALNAGHAFGETAEISGGVGGFSVAPAALAPGHYRTVTGAEAMAWGLVTGTQLVGLEMVFASYPITPASSLLHSLAGLHGLGVTTFQAEDEISAVCAAIGASYAGSLGVTSSSGPGIALKTEGIGLAISTELPLLIVDTQRAGPSTGMPTKTEQSDLHQAVFGRNADSPLAVLAARSPADCFDVAIEAVRIATKYMTPVILLSDGYIANAAEPWMIPDVGDLAVSPVQFRTEPEGFGPYLRDEKTLARDWVVPGTPGLEHRIGGIEKDEKTGHISYDPANHQRMTDLRIAKIEGIANDIPEQGLEDGEPGGDIVLVGWGSTYGPINRAVTNLRAAGLNVAHAHIRHICPFPKNLADLLNSFGQVLVPELNAGQLLTMLRSKYLIPAEGLNKVSGQPFKISEIEAAVRARLEA